MTRINRDAMEQRIQTYLDRSTDILTTGDLFIMYERLQQFQWLPGDGDGKRNRSSKHWKLIIIIGDEKIKIDFAENGNNTEEGIVILSTYDPYQEELQPHFLGNITIDTETLYSNIQDMFLEWREYSIKYCNCQHFVRDFVIHFWNHLSNRDEHIMEVTAEKGVSLQSRIGSAFNTVGSRSNLHD